MVTNQENESVPAITSEKRPPDTDPVPPYHRDASSRRAELEPVSGHCSVFRVPSAGCLPTSRASARPGAWKPSAVTHPRGLFAITGQALEEFPTSGIGESLENIVSSALHFDTITIWLSNVK
jgi:hypothetical protein